MIKRVLISIVALALLAVVCGGIVWFNFFREQATAQFFATMQAPALTVSTVKAEPMKWTPGIETIGTVKAASGVDLTVETTGVVKDIRFSANQRVKQGDVLVQLDDAVERADLEAQKAQLDLAKLALNRALELQKRGVGSDVTVDAARSASAALTAQVAKLQAVLDQKQLKAPFSGTMGIAKIDPGQYLAPGTIVATLQDLDTMHADFSVPEQQLTLLKIGQPVRFGVSGEDMPFTGTITGIEPKVDPISRLVAVEADVANPGGALSPGQFVQVRVVLPEEDGVLALPQTALVSSLYGDYIYVVRPAKKAEQPAKPADEKPVGDISAKAAAAEAKPTDTPPGLVANQIFVKLGRRSEGLVEITEGLTAGDEVVSAGQNRLYNGVAVKVDNTIDPSKPSSVQAAAK